MQNKNRWYAHTYFNSLTIGVVGRWWEHTTHTHTHTHTRQTNRQTRDRDIDWERDETDSKREKPSTPPSSRLWSRQTEAEVDRGRSGKREGGRERERATWLLPGFKNMSSRRCIKPIGPLLQSPSFPISLATEVHLLARSQERVVV